MAKGDVTTLVFSAGDKSPPQSRRRMHVQVQKSGNRFANAIKPERIA